MRGADSRLLVRAVGFGLMIAELLPEVPQAGSVTTSQFLETVKAMGNCYPDEKVKVLDRLIRDSGIPVQEVIPYPGDPAKAFFLMPEGLPPTILEKNQTTEEDWESIRAAVVLSGSARLAYRLSLLEPPQPTV